MADERLPAAGLRNERKPVSEVLLSLLVDMFELGVAVRVARSFERLLVRLQAISELYKQLGHELVTHLMTLGLELRGENTDALARPSQRRFRISARDWFHQLLQIHQQRRIFVDVLLPSTSQLSDSANALRTPACLAGMMQLLQFAFPSSDRSARNTSRPRNY